MTAPTPPALGIPLLFDYLFWLRDRIIRAATGLTDEAFRATPLAHGRDLRATLVHELDVELSWRGRLQGLPESAWGADAGLEPERYPRLADLVHQWAVDEAKTRAWIGRLAETDLVSPVTVNGLEGYALSIYLLHVVEHGVTEFTAAATILDGLGVPPGELGLLNALDDLSPMPRTR